MAERWTEKQLLSTKPDRRKNSVPAAVAPEAADVPAVVADSVAVEIVAVEIVAVAVEDTSETQVSEAKRTEICRTNYPKPLAIGNPPRHAVPLESLY